VTLDREDIQAIASEVVRLLAPMVTNTAPPEQPARSVSLPGSYSQRKEDALARHIAGKARKEARRGDA